MSSHNELTYYWYYSKISKCRNSSNSKQDQETIRVNYCTLHKKVYSIWFKKAADNKTKMFMFFEGKNYRFSSCTRFDILSKKYNAELHSQIIIFRTVSYEWKVYRSKIL